MPYSRKPLICKIDDLPRVLKMILAHQLLYATKPRDDEWSKTKWSWRELFSELIEPPIHPHLIQVVPPFLEESNPVYMIQMSCEVAWKCREFTGCLIEYLIYSKRASCLSARSLMNLPAIAMVAKGKKLVRCKQRELTREPTSLKLKHEE